MRRHRPIGSLKYPGPHFRLAVPDVELAVVADPAVAATVDGEYSCGCGGGDVLAATAGGSVGWSDALLLLAISASTIWTILSLLDGEYGSSSAADCDAGCGVPAADAALTPCGAGGLVVGDALVADGGLDGASVGSV